MRFVFATQPQRFGYCSGLVKFKPMIDVRSQILEIARAELGSGRPDVYWRDVLGPKAQPPWPKAWCGAFALWCLHQAGLALDVNWKIGYGFCEVQRLPRVRAPQPGDIAYFDKPFQHHAIVARIEFDPQIMLSTIDGNQGLPEPVREKHRHVPVGTVFYSIAPFIERRRDPSLPPPRAPSSPDVLAPTLQYGSTGPVVAELQKLLNVASTGTFGDRTRLAVVTLQKKFGLKVDGIVGPKTWGILGR